MEQQLRKKILPVKYPAVTSWPSHAMLFTILESRKESQDWIYCNHIQTYSSKYSFPRYSNTNDAMFIYDYLPNTMNYLMCPWLNTQIINSELIKMKFQDINELITVAINSDSYVYIVINEKYILGELLGPEATWFHHHGLLIYGYDLDTRKYYVADFFRNKKYSFEEVSMDNISRGYADIPDGEEYSKGGTVLLKFNDSATYNFDSELVKNDFNNYYNSTSNGLENLYRISTTDNTIGVETINVGLSAYHLLYEYFPLVERNEVEFDMSNLHAIYDHKKLMHMRINFMLENKYLKTDTSILKEFGDIEHQALQLRNLYIKYLLSNDSLLIKKAITICKQIEEKEQELMPILIDGIICTTKG